MNHDSLDMLLLHWAGHDPGRCFLHAESAMSFTEAEKEVQRRALRLTRANTGRAILLAGSNRPSWILNLLAAFRSKTPVVLIPPGWTHAEEAQVAEIAGATLRVEGENLLAAFAGRHRERRIDWEASGAAMAFPTSGSTGRPRLALRSSRSLVAEGERYHMLWHLSREDVLAAVLPLCHAYAFGAALAASLVAGCALALDNSNSPRRLACTLMERRVTILPLVGPVARSLARLDSGRSEASALRVAMVGAGVVTREMSNLFQAKWGLPLSQNYGSSETGALLAAFPPESIAGTGFPMPGVECSLSEATDGTSELWVRTEVSPLGYLMDEGFTPARMSPGGWWATGDLFSCDVTGLYTMLGRLSQHIRRGGRSIYPREVEGVLLAHEAVEEAVVRGGRESDEQECIEAQVLLKAGARATAVELREHVLSQLAAYKCPTRWDIRDEFPRTWSNKLSFRPMSKGLSNLTRQDDAILLPALLSHRLSAAVIAADAVGIFDALSQKALMPERLAEALRLDRDALLFFAKFLQAAGLVSEGAEGLHLTEACRVWLKPTVALEARLRKTWLTPEAIADVLRHGISRRTFERLEPDAKFAQVYRDVMCGPWQQAVARQVIRIASLPQEARVLEIGRGVGLLSVTLRRERQSVEAEWIALRPAPALVCEGALHECEIVDVPLCGWDEIAPVPGRFSLIFVVNAIHWLHASQAPQVFARLLDGLAPGGRLVIADIFLPSDMAYNDHNLKAWCFILDWMTHGGTNFLTVADVLEPLVKECRGKVVHRSLGNLPLELIYASSLSESADTVPHAIREETHP